MPICRRCLGEVKSSRENPIDYYTCMDGWMCRACWEAEFRGWVIVDECAEDCSTSHCPYLGRREGVLDKRDEDGLGW